MYGVCFLCVCLFFSSIYGKAVEKSMDQIIQEYARRHPNLNIGEPECEILTESTIGERAAEYAKKFPNTATQPDPELGVLWGGDIITMGEDNFNEINPLNSVVLRNRTWPNGVLYYDIKEEDFDEEQLGWIEAGVRDLEGSTMVDGEFCVELVRIDRDTGEQRDYVWVWDRTSCSSAIGRLGFVQPLSLGPTCVNRHGTIMHEFLHALGFFHEQQRGDRDEYVEINWENIQPGTEANFNKREENVTIDHLGTAYDYGSVLHYPAYGFAVDPDIPTIIPLDPDAEIGQRIQLSDLDIERVQILYECIKPEDSKYFKHLSDVELFQDVLD